MGTWSTNSSHDILLTHAGLIFKILSNISIADKCKGYFNEFTKELIQDLKIIKNTQLCKDFLSKT